MPLQDSRQQIIDLYEKHPARQGRILDRVRRERGSLEDLSEMDLATSSGTGATDQNHIGGTDALDELAELCSIGAETRVLDLGSGLGGSARYLAERFGARVTGIELVPERCRQARALSRLVGLEDHVRFDTGDFLTHPLPRGVFDVVLCQAAAVHVADKRRLVTRAFEALHPCGRFALEEPGLATAQPDGRIDELATAWQAHLIQLEEWGRLAREAGFELLAEQDLSTELLRHHEELLAASAAREEEGVPASERRAWELACELGREGRLGYVRLVARRP